MDFFREHGDFQQQQEFIVIQWDIFYTGISSISIWNVDEYPRVVIAYYAKSHFFTGKTSQQCLSTWVVILWMGQRNPNPPVEDGGKHSEHPMILFGFQPSLWWFIGCRWPIHLRALSEAAQGRPSAWFCCSRSASSGSRGCSQESTSGTSSARCRRELRRRWSAKKR